MVNQSEIIRYKKLLEDIKMSSDKTLEETLAVSDLSYEIAINVGCTFYRQQKSSLLVNSKVASVVKTKMLVGFTMHLFFGYSSDFVSGKLNISRATLLHYCKVLIDEYTLYNDFSNQLNHIFGKDTMEEMIALFKSRKKTKNKKI